jgi:hypothetical protein
MAKFCQNVFESVSLMLVQISVQFHSKNEVHPRLNKPMATPMEIPIWKFQGNFESMNDIVLEC